MDAQGRPPAVIVGVDGRAAAHTALLWAAETAARRGERLRVVHGLGMPLVTSAYSGSERYRPEEGVREAGRRLLDESVEQARGVGPELGIDTVLAPEEAPAALLNEARHGDVIVVGSRGLGAVRSIMLGSVSVRTSAQAPCPVIVVPEAATEHRGRIVVGVDGSASSRRALRFALRHALLVGASVEVVNSWQVPLPRSAEPLGADSGSLHEEVFDRQSEEIVAGVLAEVIDDETEDLDISAVRMRSDPVEALVEAGREAELLVVGSRGRGGVRGLVMGSTSQGVLRQAKVPVAVLPPDSDETD